MENIISTIFSTVNPSYFLLTIPVLFIILMLAKKVSIKISFDYKKGKVKIKVHKKI